MFEVCVCGVVLCEFVSGSIFVYFGEFVVWRLVCGVLGDRLKFVVSPDIILCDWLGSEYEITSFSFFFFF